MKRKSSYSNPDGGQCIEIADNHPALVPVRDSKDPHGPALVFPAGAWGPSWPPSKAERWPRTPPAPGRPSRRASPRTRPGSRPVRSGR
ncbi:DUF397 domain-containing protein [Streptomyces sp. NPDC020883]|uniref:DUF397 domain-containing protein n=1 Tax=Streptomyces sp. NPDC020883 TaxID=3365099 RepID=UPI00378F2DF8